MAEPIAAPANVAPGNLRAENFRAIFQTYSCLTEDEQLSLHRGLGFFVVVIGLTIHAMDELLNGMNAVEDVFEVGSRILKRHEQPPAKHAPGLALSLNRREKDPPSLPVSR